jgi:formylglycine-generating enzyme required for sulfatase activity
MIKFFLIILFLFSSSEIIAPLGTIKISNNVYIDKNIVSISEWKEFMANQRMKGRALTYPDTTIYRDGLNYFNNEQFEELPVSGVDLNMIKTYYEFKSEITNLRISKYHKRNKCDGDFFKVYNKNNLRVKYRLPTKDELDYAFEKGIIKKTEYQEITQETKDFESLDKMKIAFRCVAEVIEL